MAKTTVSYGWLKERPDNQLNGDKEQIFIPGIAPAGSSTKPIYVDADGQTQECGIIDQAAKVQHQLIIGPGDEKFYDGSSEVRITAADLGLSNAIKFIGNSSSEITDGGNETPTIDEEEIIPQAGNVVLYGNKEFIWTINQKWEELGDEGSHALKTINIKGGGPALTGEGSLTGDVILYHDKEYGAKDTQKKYTSSNTNWIIEEGTEASFLIPQFVVDEYGHVIEATDHNLTIKVPETTPVLTDLNHKTQNINKDKTNTELTYFDDNVTITGTLDVNVLKMNSDTYSFADSSNNALATFNNKGIESVNFIIKDKDDKELGNLNTVINDLSIAKNDINTLEEKTQNITADDSNTYITGTLDVDTIALNKNKYDFFDTSNNVIASIADTGITATNFIGDARVNKPEHHYTPTANSASTLSVDASSTTAATWGTTDLVTGVNIQRDAKGHVTGLTVDSVQMPASPTTLISITNTGEGNAVTAGSYDNGVITLTKGSNFKTKQSEVKTPTNTTGNTSSFVDSITQNTNGVISYTKKNVQITIDAAATDDDVVILTATDGTNGVSYDAKHAEKGPALGSYTKTSSTASIQNSAGTGTIKIPQITVDKYGHVTGAEDETVSITMPNLSTLENKTWFMEEVDKNNGYSKFLNHVSIAGQLEVEKGFVLNDDEFTFCDAPDASGNAETIATINDKGISATYFNGKLGNNGVGLTTGSTNKPIYFNNGLPTAIDYEVNKTVPSNAIFTDTTYSLSGALTDNNTTYTVTLTSSSENATTAKVPKMTAATASVAGKAGLVPAPAIANDKSFLRGDGTWSKSTDTFEVTGDTTIGGTLDVDTIALNKNKYDFFDTSNNVIASIDKNGIAATNFIGDGRVNKVDHHYIPAKSKIIEASSSASAGSWNDTSLVTGIEMDAAGHVTGVTSAKLPANPDTGVTSVEVVGDGPVINAASISGRKLSLTKGDAHIYMTGVADVSTSNTTQLVFGPSTVANQHVALSSNDNALVINPSVDSTENQIVLYLNNKQSIIPGGICEGYGHTVGGASTYSHVEGVTNTVSGLCAHAEGSETVASGDISHAEGIITTASGCGSHAEGRETVASGENSHAEGNGIIFSIKATGAANALSYTFTSDDIPEEAYVFYIENAAGEYIFANNYGSDIEVDKTLSTTAISNKEFYCYTSVAAGFGSHIEGMYTIAKGEASHSEGFYTLASGDYSHAEGYQNEAEGDCSHVEGHSTLASGDYSHAEGKSSNAAGWASHAEGESSHAAGQGSHAEGSNSIAAGIYSHAEGRITKAQGNSSHSEGQSTEAFGDSSHTEGYRTLAYGFCSHAEGGADKIVGGIRLSLTGEANATTYTCIFTNGYQNLPRNSYILLNNNEPIFITRLYQEGSSYYINVEKTLSSTAISNKAFVVYIGSISKGDYSHSEGYRTAAIGINSHSEGCETTAVSPYSHAEGNKTIAEGYYSHTEGCETTALNDCAHAEGFRTTASNYYSHAEGERTTALGRGSHSEGGSSLTIVVPLTGEANSTTYTCPTEFYTIEIGSYVIVNNQPIFIVNGAPSVEGVWMLEFEKTLSNIAITNKEFNIYAGGTSIGDYSHTEGYCTIAKGNYSHAGGLNTVAQGEATTAIGKYNFYEGLPDNAYAFVIGNGSASARSNAFFVDWSGNTEATGTLRGTSVYGAVWNDYAEFRELKEKQETPPYGRIVIENGDDTLSLSTKRLQAGGNVCSDTFGFSIGETEQAKMPIAVAGRALVYTWEDRNSFEPGDAVCTGPEGTVSKMTRKEIREWPDRIIGYVSAIPTYETWGQNNVKVDNRIWIKVI